jgi:L-lactate dehydrogenase complex protein LldG
MSPLETGDRAAFLTRLRHRLADGVPANPAHPMGPALAAVPVAVSDLLAPTDLIASFVTNARAARVVVHEISGDVVPDALIAEIVLRHRVRRAVVTAEPEAQAAAAQLTARGVEVSALSLAAAADADLGVTSATYALATTGTLVVSTDAAGGRSASLLPPVHLCVLPATRIVASSADVLRRLGTSDAGRPPSNLVLVTGPSRSGDIEQIIALGVHGPITVEVALLLGH